MGPWCGQINIMWKTPNAGQTGYFQRTELNKWLVKIGKEGKDVNPKSGFTNYGLVKNDYVLIKGSVAGPKKRLIRLNYAIRPSKKIQKEAPAIRQIVKWN